jgi:hypothetical protein
VRRGLTLSAVLLVSALIFVDSRLGILFFEKEPSFALSATCTALGELEDLESALKTENERSISESVYQLAFSLNAAYVFGIMPTAPAANPRPSTETWLERDLLELSLAFERLNEVDPDGLEEHKMNIESSKRSAQQFFKDHC